jgi:cytochrome bd-type quinol oxidase subunit 2
LLKAQVVLPHKEKTNSLNRPAPPLRQIELYSAAVAHCFGPSTTTVSNSSGTLALMIGSADSFSPFLGAIALFTMGYVGLAISLWPNIVPHVINLASQYLLTKTHPRDGRDKTSR